MSIDPLTLAALIGGGGGNTEVSQQSSTSFLANVVTSINNAFAGDAEGSPSGNPSGDFTTDQQAEQTAAIERPRPNLPGFSDVVGGGGASQGFDFSFRGQASGSGVGTPKKSNDALVNAGIIAGGVAATVGFGALIFRLFNKRKK